MRKIGLLSDTHSHVDDRMLKFLEPVDEVWHAGDMGNQEVVDRLMAFKLFRAVYGNIDDARLRMQFPLVQQFTVEKVNVLMTHIGGYPGKYAPGIKKMIQENQSKLFISGHSHILKVVFDKALNCLHINPGAAGMSGFHQVRTMIRFIINGTEIKDLEVWEYPRKE